MRIRPIGDNVVIKRAKPDEKSKGGLYIPDTAQQKSICGEVLEVGPGRINGDGNVVPMPPGIFPGKTVAVSNRYTGTEVTIEGETYLVVDVDSVVGIIEP